MVARCAFPSLDAQIDTAEMNNRDRSWKIRGLDFAPSPSEPHLREDTPVVVVLHGLTGGNYLSCGFNGCELTEPWAMQVLMNRTCEPYSHQHVRLRIKAD